MELQPASTWVLPGMLASASTRLSGPSTASGALMIPRRAGSQYCAHTKINGIKWVGCVVRWYGRAYLLRPSTAWMVCSARRRAGPHPSPICRLAACRVDGPSTTLFPRFHSCQEQDTTVTCRAMLTKESLRPVEGTFVVGCNRSPGLGGRGQRRPAQFSAEGGGALPNFRRRTAAPCPVFGGGRRGSGLVRTSAGLRSPAVEGVGWLGPGPGLLPPPTRGGYRRKGGTLGRACRLSCR